MNQRQMIGCTAGLILVGVLGTWMVTQGYTGKPTGKHLVVQSNVEMTETNINSQIAGRVKRVTVNEGDRVAGNQTLLIIDSDTLNAQYAQAQARIETIKAQINAALAAKATSKSQFAKVQNGARPEEIAQAKAAYDLAQTTYDRVKTLYDRGLISRADYDNASTQLEINREKYNLAKNGARSEDISMAHEQYNQANSSVESLYGQLKQAEAAQAEIKTYLDRTTIVAPTDGVITQLNVEAGELVSTGMPLVIVTDQAKPWIQCSIKETDLAQVRLGQPVTVKLAAYQGQTFTGKVVRINKDADFAVKRATNDNGQFDVLSYGVKVELTQKATTLYDGMTAFVDFGATNGK